MKIQTLSNFILVFVVQLFDNLVKRSKMQNAFHLWVSFFYVLFIYISFIYVSFIYVLFICEFFSFFFSIYVFFLVFWKRLNIYCKCMKPHKKWRLKKIKPFTICLFGYLRLQSKMLNIKPNPKFVTSSEKRSYKDQITFLNSRFDGFLTRVSSACPCMTNWTMTLSFKKKKKKKKIGSSKNQI